nr:PREDICTED: centromere protein W [Pelecanus crispus]
MACAHCSALELLGVTGCQLATNAVSAVTYRQRGGKIRGETDDWSSEEASPHVAIHFENRKIKVHLNFLLFLHRLAEEARTNAFESKSKIIKPEHTIAAAKVILKKSRG